jgi:hypothetical protein
MPDNRIDEGFRIIIAIAGVTTPLYWETEVTPPGWSGGDLIPTSNQRNSTHHTASPQTLIKSDDITVTVQAAVGAFAQLRAITNVNKEMTLTFPNGYTQIVWISLRDVKPSVYKIGEQPKFTLTFGVTNTNASGVETPPVEAAPPP